MIILKRFAVVSWWLGTTMFVVALYCYGNDTWQYRGCAAVFEEESALQRRSAELKEDYKVARSKELQRHKEWWKSFQEDTADIGGIELAYVEPVDLLLSEYIDAVQKLPRRTGYDADLKRCRMAAIGYEMSGGLSLLAGFTLWILAYILSGSFWRPPRV